MRIEDKGSVAFLALLNLLFVFALFLSGLTNGFLSTIIYIFAFILPIAIGFKESKSKNNDGDFLGFDGVSKSLPFVAPTLVLVMAIAYVTSILMMAITHKTNDADLGSNIFIAVLTHALAPAILEEAVFRYIPLRVMKGEGRVTAIFASSIFFSLMHHNFFSMPYAFVAGLIFMALDMYVGSVWPSVIIHFLNNALSVLWYFYGESMVFVSVVLSMLAIFAVASIIYIILNKEKYRKNVVDLLSEKLEIKSTTEVWIFACSMILIAIMELFT